ncbi:hypothetical protein MU666_24305, partial [Salmonella enterica subsp. enterica serovar Enteritidis]|nr:hypothetical protein [Salmonella enterica subsp. enterica serovar Enteritidis]
QNDVTLKMPAFEWVHVQLHQQKGMISLSPPTICNSAKMTNKFTSKVSYTDALTVVTYKQPKLSIDVTDILQGSDVPVTLLDNDEPIPAGTAEVLWSEDKVNWVQGDTTYTVASADTLPS